LDSPPLTRHKKELFMKKFFRMFGTQVRPLLSTVCAISLVAAIGLSMSACGGGDDDGGGGSGAALNGTWDSGDGEKIVLNNGSFTISQDNVEAIKGTYSAIGSNITMTVTQVTGAFLMENDFPDMGLSLSQWYTQQALQTAIINYYVGLGMTQAQAQSSYNQDVAPIMSQAYRTESGTLIGNALTIGGDTYTKAGGGGGGSGGGSGTGGNSGTWNTVGNSTFGETYVNAIAYGNNKFVAVGSEGKIAYSANGETWTAITPGTGTGTSTFGATGWIYTIAYGNGKFVAGSNSGKMAYSLDGENWTAIPPDTETNPLYLSVEAIAFGDGRFVAGCSLGKMGYSSDGINWTAASNAAFNDCLMKGIAYGNGKFVAVGSKGKMAYSSDGITWTAVSNSGFGTSSINAIAYGDGKFVAVGDGGKIAYSSNGETWTTANSSFEAYQYIQKIAYGNNQFVAGGSGMAFSSDGATWTAVTNSPFEMGISAIAYGGGKFVAVDNSGKMAYSSGYSGTGGSGSGSPSITTASLQGGTVGTPYRQTLTASGGTPITWSRDSGSLPGGLSLSSNGTISGTPTTAGTSTFTVKATNSAGSVTKTLSIVITLSGGGTGSGSGTFTLTGISSQLNGKYATFAATDNSDLVVLGFQDSSGATLPRVSNGSVSIPLWVIDLNSSSGFSRYSGNDSLDVTVIFTNTQTDTDTVGFWQSSQNIQFSNGSATRSWSQGVNMIF
jgi:hypothetical protein